MGDEVTLAGPDEPMRGEIVKLNLKTAKVHRGKALWNGPLRPAPRGGSEEREKRRRAFERHRRDGPAADGRARDQGLDLCFRRVWRRLGDCNFRDWVIRIGRAHAPEDGEERSRDTVLLWKATARRIGATPRARDYETRAG